jgi:hypothetical protein
MLNNEMRMWFSLTLQAKVGVFIRATIIAWKYQHRLLTLQTYDFRQVDGWESSKENPHPTNLSNCKIWSNKRGVDFLRGPLELD